MYLVFFYIEGFELKFNFWSDSFSESKKNYDYIISALTQFVGALYEPINILSQ